MPKLTIIADETPEGAASADKAEAEMLANIDAATKASTRAERHVATMRANTDKNAMMVRRMFLDFQPKPMNAREERQVIDSLCKLMQERTPSGNLVYWHGSLGKPISAVTLISYIRGTISNGATKRTIGENLFRFFGRDDVEHPSAPVASSIMRPINLAPVLDRLDKLERREAATFSTTRQILEELRQLDENLSRFAEASGWDKWEEIDEDFDEDE